MAEERLKLAVFIDFDNIQIGVKDTLGKDFDVALVLEALKERGEVVTKVAYGDWQRAGEFSRRLTQHAVQMVQRNVTPRGDKNGADINLALDALEMAFTRHHINSFAIVGGDSDFMALVEKLKQYDKQVLVVGGRSFTSNILQRNCTEFIAYENLLKSETSRTPRGGRRGESAARAAYEIHPLSDALPNLRRALKVLADREVSPQLGLLKSTMLQLDSTFSERDYGSSSFLEFIQKMEHDGLVRLRRTDRGYLVESTEGEPAPAEAAPSPEIEPTKAETVEEAPAETEAGPGRQAPVADAEAMRIVRQAVAAAAEKSPNRPLYLRHIRQALRTLDKAFDEERGGFRGIMDLLHQGQREGWLHLQRDRKGIWRVFPVASVMAAAPAADGAGRELHAVQAEAAASTDFWQSQETIAAPEPDLAAPSSTVIEEAPVESVPMSSELSAAEAAQSMASPDGAEEIHAARKTQKHPARGTGKTAARKRATRRKVKEVRSE